MSNGSAYDQLTPLQTAVHLLKRTQARLEALQTAASEPIAIVGLGCRFPGGAEDAETYWRVLAEGVDAISEVPPDRFDINEYYDPDPSAPHRINTRWGGFLKQVGDFDAEFFGISPREAIRVDPQQRLLLEVAWEALENAGIPPSQLAQSLTGVYVGVLGFDYALIQSKQPADMDIFSGTGSCHSILANRVSYFLNLNGPSITLDTACSSSLVTVHLACQSLRRKESDLALAGGVNLILTPDMSLGLTKAHMMAPDGRCKTFDESANGYVRGEGCGLVVLKRLSDAVARGDRILALIRGSAVNHDGRSNGLSAPSGPAQEAVLKTALADADLQPHDVDYVEAHGTGTKLGDPIEIDALRTVLGQGRPVDRPLVVGSVKTNIGHLESAAGIAGLIKLVLMFRNGQVPAPLHLKTLNPLLNPDDPAIEIPRSLRDWPRLDRPRRAGVSSFGFGGTNAHVILEEAPEVQKAPEPETRSGHVLALSARNAKGLADQATRFADFVEAHPGVSIADLAHTANTGREQFPHRMAVVARSVGELHDRLRASANGTAAGVAIGHVAKDQAPRIAFLFTGQGAQYAGMGRGLYETEPVFRAAFDRCAEGLRPHLDRPLLSLLAPESGELLNQTIYTQPALFSLEYALADLWRSWGLVPAAVMGHSVGELAAVCVAGALSLEDALRLTAGRARLMQLAPAGGLMAAVFTSHARVIAELRHVSDQVSIAAFNGPQNVVISGDATAVRAMLEKLSLDGIASKTLTTSHAFHSHHLDSILVELEQLAGNLSWSPAKIEIVTNVTGQPAQADTYSDPHYWSRQAREPVRFSQSIETLVERGCEVFLEIGPSPTLIGMGQRCVAGDGLAWLTSLRSGRDDAETILGSLAQLSVRGAAVDWAGFYKGTHWNRIDLPTYPFQRKRYWSGAIPSPSQAESSIAQGKLLHPLIGRKVVTASEDRIFEVQLSANRPALLADHTLYGQVIMPGAGYVEMALAASTAAFGKTWDVREITLVEPLLLDKSATTVQTVVSPEGPQAARFRIAAVTPGEDDAEPTFVTLATGRMEASRAEAPIVVDIEAGRRQFSNPLRDQDWQIAILKKRGLEPGSRFLWSPRHWFTETQALAELRPAQPADQAADYHLHPGLLDGGFQLLGSLMPGVEDGSDAFVPVTIQRLTVHARPTEAAYFQATMRSFNGVAVIGDLQLLNAAGRVLVRIEGVELRRVPREWLARRMEGSQPAWLYEVAWVPHARDARPVTPPGSWLILDSSDGLGGELSERLSLKGHSVSVLPAELPAHARREQVRSFVAAAKTDLGIIHLSACDAEVPDFARAQEHGWGAVLDVLGGLAESVVRRQSRLFLVTRGAQCVTNQPATVCLEQAPLWGLGRVVATEHPELACTRIDLDPGPLPETADVLAEELLLGDGEDQIAFRRGERFVARLRSRRDSDSGALPLPKNQPYRLEITERGQLGNIALRPVSRPKPGPGQVEIRVRATGLNFRDVLNVLDLYPGDPGPLGGECAGEVTAVGAGVDSVKVGDAVVGLAPASFASYVVTPAEFVVHKPEHLSFAEAATIPICFLTSHLTLVELGRLQPGERVLIHAATGGVGLSALQIARHVGAEIFATAGSPAKREYLKSMGIEHVFDSRSLAFADQIRKATNGEGIDLVLNSLTGEAIRAGLSVLREGGRFMELGKTDLWDQARVAEFKAGVTFFPIALDHMMADDPPAVGRLLRAVIPQFEDRRLSPLPLRTYRIERTVDALRHMAKTEHIGKVVIQAAVGDDAPRPGQIRSDGTYLITGGLGGLGLKLAEWLVNRGARSLLLLGRSDPSPEASEVLVRLRKSGAKVVPCRCDVANRSSLAALLESSDISLPPLRGVFHLAGVLDDGVLSQQSRERFDKVMASKMHGAWHLHELTRDRPLDLFVLFSSAAAILGSPGQANYAAANAFLDALAHHRRHAGLPGLSINWGAWSEVGMAARLAKNDERRLSATGLGAIEPERGLQLLEQLLNEDATQAAALPVDWPKFLERIPEGSEPAWLRDIARQARTASESHDSTPVMLNALKDVTPAERRDLVIGHLQSQASRVLALDADNLPDPRRTLNELGFDSLTGVEFVNRVGRSIQKPLNPSVLFDHPTLEGLADHLLRSVLQLESVDTPAENAAEEPDEIQVQAAVAVDGMSDEELDAMVARQLEKLQA